MTSTPRPATDAEPTAVFCESAAEWDHDWRDTPRGPECIECGTAG